MDYRPLGSTGVQVSRVILGCGNFGGIGSAPEFFGQGEDDAAAAAIMDRAWELGITTFDTADAYGGGRSEAAIGAWMRARGVRPVLTTKTFNPMEAGADHGLAPARVRRQLESSLGRLGVERVELFLTHEPDPDVPLAAGPVRAPAPRRGLGRPRGAGGARRGRRGRHGDAGVRVAAHGPARHRGGRRPADTGAPRARDARARTAPLAERAGRARVALRLVRSGHVRALTPNAPCERRIC